MPNKAASPMPETNKDKVRDESVARQQYSQQRLASKTHMTAATKHTQAKLRFHALHVLRGTGMMKYN